MKKIIFLIILYCNLPLLYAMDRPNVKLFPLCYSDTAVCNRASTILKLPAVGKFWVNSICRGRLQEEARVCSGMILDVEAFINLGVGYWQMRNQCYRNPIECNQALTVWKQLLHVPGAFTFDGNCKPYVRGFWQMNDAAMDANGIFRCDQFAPIELKIKAQRVK